MWLKYNYLASPEDTISRAREQSLTKCHFLLETSFFFCDLNLRGLLVWDPILVVNVYDEICVSILG